MNEIFFSVKIVMARERQLSLYQLPKPDIILKQLLSNATDRQLKNSSDFDRFRELGKTMPELNQLPPRARPLLLESVKLFDKVNYTMRTGLGQSSSLLMMFVVKVHQVYQYDEEAYKKELVQIKDEIDQNLLKELTVFAKDIKEKFFNVFGELVKIGGSELFQNLLSKREQINIKIKDILNNINSLNRKLQREEGELKYFNSEIDAISKDVKSRQLLKNESETKLENLKEQLQECQRKLSHTSQEICEVEERGFFIFKTYTVHRYSNPAYADAQKCYKDLNDKMCALSVTLKNWNSGNEEKLSEYKEKLIMSKRNIANYNAEIKDAKVCLDQKMTELHTLTKIMYDEYNGSSFQDLEALQMVDKLAITINNGITFLYEAISAIIIETNNVVRTNSNDKNSLSLSLPAALNLIGIADHINNNNMIEQLRNSQDIN